MIMKKMIIYLLGAGMMIFSPLAMAERYLTGSVTVNNESEPQPNYPAPGAQPNNTNTWEATPPPPPPSSSPSEPSSGGSVTVNNERQPQSPTPAPGSGINGVRLD
jgi:hypothetical protein